MSKMLLSINPQYVEHIFSGKKRYEYRKFRCRKDVDKIYVVGGTNSNNSKTLFNIAKTTYPNISVELIQNAEDIKEKDLIGLSHIAISSGASTPKEIIEQIKSKLLN